MMCMTNKCKDSGDCFPGLASMQCVGKHPSARASGHVHAAPHSTRTSTQTPQTKSTVEEQTALPEACIGCRGHHLHARRTPRSVARVCASHAQDGSPTLSIVLLGRITARDY